MNFESSTERNRRVPRVNKEIARRLGEAGIGDVGKIPRKTKKAAKKEKEGRALSSQELARLAALRRRSGE